MKTMRNNGLKGQQLSALGNALGSINSLDLRPVRAKELMPLRMMLLPLQGEMSLASIPRATFHSALG